MLNLDKHGKTWNNMEYLGLKNKLMYMHKYVKKYVEKYVNKDVHKDLEKYVKKSMQKSMCTKDVTRMARVEKRFEN